jgi:hypothetical protein
MYPDRTKESDGNKFLFSKWYQTKESQIDYVKTADAHRTVDEAEITRRTSKYITDES